MNKAISYRKDGKIIIEIPEELISFAIKSEYDSNCFLKDPWFVIKNQDQLMNEISNKILNFGETDNNEPKFLKLLDAIVIDIFESGSTALEEKYHNYN